jgi:GNAT superfamily N-acetyltransferase
LISEITIARANQFWAATLGLPETEFANAETSYSSSGHYAEAGGGRRFFAFYDLRRGKKVYVSSVDNLEQFKNSVSANDRNNLWPDQLRLHPFFRNAELVHMDVDHFLGESELPSLNFANVRQLTYDDKESIDKFMHSCPAEDIDTLDLSSDDEFVFGAFSDEVLAGVSRAIRLSRSTEIADITVLISPDHRGRGLAVPLVAALVGHLLNLRLTPRYRVEETNLASLAIAKKLAFQPVYKLFAWDLSI